MRWKPVKPKPKHLDLRFRRKFAWLPTQVEDHTVWLETYQITERYMELDIPGYWKEEQRNLLYLYY